MPSKVCPHGGLLKLAPGVWTLRGISRIPLYRNMIVVRLADGGLVLHSVVAVEEAGLQALVQLGRPAVAIVPSRGHKMDAAYYQARFPELKVVCPAGAVSAVAPHVRLAGTVEDVVPGLGWTLHKVPGFKVDEYVYELPIEGGGRMLMANDVFGGANAAEKSLRGRLLIAPMSSLGGRDLGIARVVRWGTVRDLAAVKRFAGTLAEVPDLRLITVSHGDAVTDRPQAKLRAIAA